MKGRYQLGFVLVLVVCLQGQVLAQRQESLPAGSLQEQFDYLVKESSPYKTYKVVPQTWLDIFRTRVQDTLLAQQKLLRQNLDTIYVQQKKITTLNTEKTALNDQIEILKREKNSLSLLGITINKSVYHVLVWSIIGGLSVGLLFFLGRFRYANAITQKKRSENQELQEKVEQLRRRMLEKEQELRRQLQDEINKRLR